LFYAHAASDLTSGWDRAELSGRDRAGLSGQDSCGSATVESSLRRSSGMIMGSIIVSVVFGGYCGESVIFRTDVAIISFVFR
jgi:hypothetical protein